MEQGTVEELKEEQRQTRTELLSIARDEPELLDDLERFERLIEFADDNPGILRDAHGFADAASE